MVPIYILWIIFISGRRETSNKMIRACKLCKEKNKNVAIKFFGCSFFNLFKDIIISISNILIMEIRQQF